MERFTKAADNGSRYVVGADLIAPDGDGYSGGAIERLAMYENIHERLLARQDDIKRELAGLRAEGRQKSGRFRELLARKLMNRSILDMFE